MKNVIKFIVKRFKRCQTYFAYLFSRHSNLIWKTLWTLLSNVVNVFKRILLINFHSAQIRCIKLCQVYCQTLSTLSKVFCLFIFTVLKFDMKNIIKFYSRTFSTLSNVFCLFIFTSLKLDMKNVGEFIVKCFQRF